MASTSPSGPPPPPPVTEIDLTQFAAIVDTARIDDERALTTGLVATATNDQPDLGLKGSLMVWDKDHLAWWERSKRETYAALGSNPHVAILVRNPTRDRRGFRFYGEARVVEDAAERDAVWERVIQIEKDADKEQKGAAVIVRIDRVRAGGFDIQRRGAEGAPSPRVVSRGGLDGTLPALGARGIGAAL